MITVAIVARRPRRSPSRGENILFPRDVIQRADIITRFTARGWSMMEKKKKRPAMYLRASRVLSREFSYSRLKGSRRFIVSYRRRTHSRTFVVALKPTKQTSGKLPHAWGGKLQTTEHETRRDETRRDETKERGFRGFRGLRSSAAPLSVREGWRIRVSHWGVPRGHFSGSALNALCVIDRLNRRRPFGDGWRTQRVIRELNAADRPAIRNALVISAPIRARLRRNGTNFTRVRAKSRDIIRTRHYLMLRARICALSRLDHRQASSKERRVNPPCGKEKLDK